MLLHIDERVAILTTILLTLVSVSYAITICTLKDPDRDVRRFFPKSSNYKTKTILIETAGGDVLIQQIEVRLGDKLDPVYEGKDIEHTTYMVLQDRKPIGYVSGINQKGEFGNLQIFMATDMMGKILKLKYQRIVSRHAKLLRNKAFTENFEGLTLADFYRNTSAFQKLLPPSPESTKDFKATLRGVKKNLIYLDLFILNRKYDAIYQKISTKKGDRKP